MSICIMSRSPANSGGRGTAALNKVSMRRLPTSGLIILIVSAPFLTIENEFFICSTVYLMHWPIPLNPNGTHFLIPTRPDGSRDIDESWNIKDTWKQLEAMLKKGSSYMSSSFLTCELKLKFPRQSQGHRCFQHVSEEIRVIPA